MGIRFTIRCGNVCTAILHLAVLVERTLTCRVIASSLKLGEQKGGLPWRAYDGGLGAELPAGVQGTEPPVGVRAEDP